MKRGSFRVLALFHYEGYDLGKGYTADPFAATAFGNIVRLSK
jgi:hypothetical protein